MKFTNTISIKSKLVQHRFDNIFSANKIIIAFPVTPHENFSLLHFKYQDIIKLISVKLIFIQKYMQKPIIQVEEGKKQFQLPIVNRYEVEQNAIFLDYQLQTLLQTIDKYSENKFHVRVSLAKNLKTVENALVNNKAQFGRLLENLSKDHEEIQLQVLSYLKSRRPVQSISSQQKQVMIKPLQNLANGPYLQIKQQSCFLLSQLAHNLSVEQLEKIIQFGNQLVSSQNQQNKIVAIQLFARLTPQLPFNKRQSIFQKQFLKIYTGSSVRVKKQIILELAKLSQSLGYEFVDKKIIREFYLKQIKQNAWGIRKACIQIIADLIVSAKSTKQQLCNALLAQLKDGNKFVRIAAHKIVPQFIAKYGQKNVPKAIFDVYVNLMDSQINTQVSRPNQIIEKISFFFPGVLQTVGVEKWPQLNPLFNKLLKNKNEDIKKPLADSLHQISQIIGPVKSKEHLFSSLDYILREPTDNIKLCAIRNLSKFVAQFEAQTKQNLIDVFLVLQKDPKKWRVRYLISSQLKYLSEIYDPETNFKYLFPISLKLCNDQVCEVRKTACEQIIHLINGLKKQQTLFKLAIQSLIGYAASEKYLQRQTFCLMIEHLYDNSDNFYQAYYEAIEKLSKDPVEIVKIALAISLANIVTKQHSQYEKLRKCIQNLSSDPQIAEYFEDINAQLKT